MLRALLTHALLAGACAQTWSPTNTLTASPLPCPVRRFPSHDLIGTVLSKVPMADEVLCMLQCCNLADLCVGYSFNAAILGSTVSGLTGTAVTDGAFGTNTGNPCGTGELMLHSLYNDENRFEGCGEYTPASYQISRLRSRIIDGTGTLTAAPCVLLSNITQLIPSNGWSGGIKLSALQNNS
jgi:hypothetical protein